MGSLRGAAGQSPRSQNFGNKYFPIATVCLTEQK